MLCLSNEFFIIRYAKINRPTRDDTEGALPVGYFELGQEAMLSLEDTVLLMVVLLVILLVTLTLAAVFRRRAHSGYVLGGWVTAFTSARGKKKHFVKEKKDKRVLTSVLQNRKEGKSPYINTSVCKLRQYGTCCQLVFSLGTTYTCFECCHKWVYNPVSSKPYRK